MQLFASLALLASVVGQFQIIIFGADSVDDNDKYATPSVTPEQLERMRDDREIPAVVVFYYTTWCRVCHSVTPEFDKAAKFFEGHSPKIPFVRLNLWSHSEHAIAYSIHELPTLHVFDNFGNEPHTFKSPYAFFKSTDLVNWVKTMLYDDNVLKDIEDVDRHLHDNDRVVLGLFQDQESNDVFKRVTSKFDGIIFSSTSDGEVSQKVASFLEKHHEHKCEVIDIGPHGATDELYIVRPLPHEEMDCSSQPVNLQHPRWTDEFDVQVVGNNVVVKRTDKEEGWLQKLQLSCCVLLTADDHKNEPIKIQVPSVVMFTNYMSDKFNTYGGSFPVNEEELEMFVKSHQKPIVSFMDQEKLTMIPSLNMPLAVLFIHSATYNKELVDDAGVAFTLAARLFPRSEIAAYIVKDDFEQISQFANMADADQNQPCIRILKKKSDNWVKYKFSGNVGDKDEILTFQRQFMEGKLHPAIMSEPIPEEEGEDDIPKVVVGLTFSNVAHDETKSVFINIYAPWCGHCIRCMPEWEKLATAVADRPDVVIAKLDGTANEVEDFPVNGFPTIVFYPAKANPDPIPYEGERTVRAWISFINRYMKEKVTPLPGDTVKSMRETRLAKKRAERAKELNDRAKAPNAVKHGDPLKRGDPSIEL